MSFLLTLMRSRSISLLQFLFQKFKHSIVFKIISLKFLNSISMYYVKMTKKKMVYHQKFSNFSSNNLETFACVSFKFSNQLITSYIKSIKSTMFYAGLRLQKGEIRCFAYCKKLKSFYKLINHLFASKWNFPVNEYKTNKAFKAIMGNFPIQTPNPIF